MKLLRSLLKLRKKQKTQKDLRKAEDPLDKDMMAGHTDDGPKSTQRSV